MPWLAAGLLGRTAVTRQPAAIAGLVVLAELVGRDRLQFHAEQFPGGLDDRLAALRAASASVRFSVSGSPARRTASRTLLARLAIEHRPLEVQRPLDLDVVDAGDRRRRLQAGLRRRGSSARRPTTVMPGALRAASGDDTTPIQALVRVARGQQGRATTA